MHTGIGLQFANLDNKVTDLEVYRRELALGVPGRGRRLRLGVGLRAPLLRLPAHLPADDVPVVGRRRRPRGSSSAPS